MGETAALPSLRFPVYPSFMRIQTLICAVLLVAAFTRGARSALVPPQQLPTGDSAGTVLEKGIEFVRLTEHVDGHFAMGKALARASALWKTDWQTPEGGGDRIRQDGHWYVGTSRGVLRSVDLWLAAQGEHFDDRPFGSSAASSPSFQIPPANPSLEASPFMSAQDVSAVRILRGGGGVSVNPWAPLRVDAGVGSVQDRRIGSVRSGLGVWSHAVVDHWNTGGYDQTFALDFNRETPREHANEDLSGHYGIFREFFPGNSNRGEITAGTLSRDVYLDPTHGGAIAKYTAKTPAGFPDASFPDVFVTPEVHGRQLGFSVESMYHFVECLRDGKPPLTSGEDGLLNTRLILAAEESAQKGLPVDLLGAAS